MIIYISIVSNPKRISSPILFASVRQVDSVTTLVLRLSPCEDSADAVGLGLGTGLFGDFAGGFGSATAGFATVRFAGRPLLIVH